MKNRDYTTFTSTDFAKDVHFIGWRFMPDASSEAFWKNFLKVHPEKKVEIDRAIEILHSVKFNRNALSFTEQKTEINRMHNRIADHKKRLRRRRILYVIAAAACILCAVLFVQKSSLIHRNSELMLANVCKEIQLMANGNITQLPQNAAIEYKSDGTILVTVDNQQWASLRSGSEINKLIVPKGRRSTLLMADGTKIWVNSDTEIEFPSSFSDDQRDMKLFFGEAYFEVAKYKHRAFRLASSDFAVKVLGTKFNVSAYKDDAMHEVVLAEGSVKVDAQVKGVLKLVPNRMAIITADGISEKEVDADSYTSWTKGVLAFSSEPLKEVLASLGRYYDVKFDRSPKTDIMKCTGKLILTENIDDALNCLETILSVKVEKSGNTFRVFLKENS